ncbi:MAG: hypothetical protein C4308_09730 [Chitinophagaceae bacterium]
MLRKLIPGFTVIILFGSCTALKPFANQSANTKSTSASTTLANTNKEVKFLDNIENSSTAPVQVSQQKESLHDVKKDEQGSFTQTKVESLALSNILVTSAASVSEIEKASSLQFKYAALLNTNVEDIQNLPLFQKIDEWWGTKFRYGGTTKKGIDCSGFVQTVFASVYGISLPRNARDQYKIVDRISTSELKEGDLLFFNTTGGVSHVAIYLQNNKFVHVSVSKGVMISDMTEPYYVKRFISAGRLSSSASLSN